MKNNTIITILIIGFYTQIPIYGTISVVYNLRIAETTKRQHLNQHSTSHSKLAALTLFDQLRRTYNGIRETGSGGLGTFVYFPESSCYLRADWAAGRVTEKISDMPHFSRVQTDDILFSGGYSVAMQQAKFTLSGLFGVPTHKDTSLQHNQLGVGHVSLGGQLDGSYMVPWHNNHTVFAAARFIHFFSRSVEAFFTPLYTHYNFGAGNLTDLFLAYHVNAGPHRFETGYNPTFLTNVTLKPYIAAVVNAINFIRSSFYGTYSYVFSSERFLQGIIAGISYSFDHRPKDFGYKRIITLWGTWGINF